MAGAVVTSGTSSAVTRGVTVDRVVAVVGTVPGSLLIVVGA